MLLSSWDVFWNSSLLYSANECTLEKKTDAFMEWTSRRPWKERKRAAKTRAATLLHISEPELIFYGKHSGVIGCTRDELYHIASDEELSTSGYDKVIYLPVLVPYSTYSCLWSIWLLQLLIHVLCEITKIICYKAYTMDTFLELFSKPYYILVLWMFFSVLPFTVGFVILSPIMDLFLEPF